MESMSVAELKLAAAEVIVVVVALLSILLLLLLCRLPLLIAVTFCRGLTVASKINGSIFKGTFGFNGSL